MRVIGPLISCVVLAIALAGCRSADPVPAGAQVVHVAVTNDTVSLEPATVHAGDVYVSLEGPVLSVGFAQSVPVAGAEPGPMNDDELKRLAGGSTEGIGVSGFDVGCSEAQQAEDRGKQGYCGNVRKQPLTVGKYAFFIRGPEGAAPKSIAILEVLP